MKERTVNLPILDSLFSCNHAGTPVHEGKCYCPDCGCGLIYRWVVLRCRECNTRRASRYRFRKIVPVQRCCALCGEREVFLETLENPAYFQLNHARLAIVYEERPPFHLGNWLRYLMGEPLADYAIAAYSWTLAWVENQLNTPTARQPALAFLPLKSTL